MFTDKVIGEMVSSLKLNELWDNTLIVFSAVNGGETAHGASNYPLRGSQGELFDGNNRVLTAVAGGLIDEDMFGERESMFSNLDWTPTLLDFAGYLECIDPGDYSWDGINQRRMVMEDKKLRTALILNIDIKDKQLSHGGASILMEHEEKLYKYMFVDITAMSQKWLHFLTTHSSDLWSKKHGVDVLVFDADNEALTYSQAVNGEFLFDSSTDPAELYNLLDPNLPYFYDPDLNEKVVGKARQILEAYVGGNKLFSSKLEFLREALEEGIPTLGADLVMQPFLTDEQYMSLVHKMFTKEQQHHSKEQRDLYEQKWTVPHHIGLDGAVPLDVIKVTEDDLKSMGNLEWWGILLIVMGVLIGTGCLILILYKCYRSRSSSSSSSAAARPHPHPHRQQQAPHPIKDQEHDEEQALITNKNYDTFTAEKQPDPEHRHHDKPRVTL